MQKLIIRLEDDLEVIKKRVVTEKYAKSVGLNVTDAWN